MKNKLSIIIPVYNVEKYIHECVESILNQKIEKCEVILVDDGSTDNSGKICDEYCSKFDYMHTIHQKNKGLSGARNTGIEYASGEYIMFLDSDDYINNECDLNVIINKLVGDIVQYKFVYFYEKNKKKIILNDFQDVEFFDKDIYEYMYKSICNGSFSGCACDKFFRTDFLKKNKLFFKEGIVCEDMEWMLRVIPYVNSYTKINENIYVYRQQRSGSITNKVKTKSIDCLFDIIKFWMNYDFKNSLQKKVYLNFLAYHYIILLSDINKNNCSEEKKREIYTYSNIVNYAELPKVRMCKKLIDIFGLNFSIWIFKKYLLVKNMGLLKIK